MKKVFDENLFVEKAIFDDSICFYDIAEAPFKLYGNCSEENSNYSRMPESVAKSISQGVADRALRSAGIRCRFKTNSKRLGIKVKFKLCSQAVTQSALSAKGFDVYVNGVYYTSLRPRPEMENYYEQLVEIGDSEEKDIIIYFPYFSVVDKVLLGIEKGSKISEGKKYRYELPVVFYGSSITQGFCVSRPGNIYSSMISRKLDTDYVNLGFSGVCRGEMLMADYLASLRKSVLVCEYDHNEADATSLRGNHLNFYKRLREKDEKTPVIFVSSPNKFYKGQCMLERMRVVESTYKYAVENGDINTYFINGQTLYPDEIRYDCSADGVHPNDLGSYMISEKICILLKKLLK